MAAESPGLLAEVYLAWMDETRLSQAQIAKFSGVRPSVLALIANGTTKRPQARTLDRIAYAFGRHPRLTHVFDRERERWSRRDLYRAAGWPDPEAQAGGAPLVEALLAPELGSRGLAAALLRRLRALGPLTEDEIGRLAVVRPDDAPRRPEN